jgi:hypothetical protein
MTLTANVACIVEKCMQSCGRKAEERGHLEDLGLDGKIILQWILKK